MFVLKRIMFGVFLFILFTSFVFAASDTEKLFDGYVYEQDDLLLDGNTLPVSIILTPTKARIVFNGDEVFLMDYNSMKETPFYTIEIGRYITNGCSGFDENKYCRIRSEMLTGSEALTKLTIVKKIPNVDVEYTINADTFYVGTTQEISILVTNKGGVDLTNFEFRDEYPWDLFISSPSAGQVLDNTIILKATKLVPGATLKSTFKVFIREPTDTVQRGIMTYNDGSGVKTLTGKSIAIKTKSPLTLSLTTQDRFRKDVPEVEIGEEYDFTITVTNNIGSQISLADLAFDFSKSFNVTKMDIDKIKGIYTYSGKIAETLKFDGEVSINGADNSLEYSYFYNNNLYKQSYAIKTKALVQEVGPEVSAATTSILTHKGYYIPYNQEQYALLLRNTGETKITNIRGSVNSGLFESSDFYVADLVTDSTATLLNVSFKLPFVEQERTYPVEYAFSYDADGKTYNVTGKETARVVPLFDVISTSEVVTKLSNYEYSVSGNVKSSLPYNVYIDGQLLHSLGPRLISDERQYSVLVGKLEPNEQKQVFSYRFFIPDGVVENITSYFWISDVLSTSEIGVSGTGTSSGLANGDLSVKTSASAKLLSGEKDTFRIIFTNPSDTKTIKNIFYEFIPSSAVSVETYGREKIRDLVPGEKYTKELTLTALHPGNVSIGYLLVSYFQDDRPFVLELKEIPIEIDGALKNPSNEVVYVTGDIGLSKGSSDDELVQLVLTNPLNKTITGTFLISNRTISFSLQPLESNDFYYSISRLESTALTRDGLGISVTQSDGSVQQQVLNPKVSSGINTVTQNVTLVDESTESTVTLVSQEDTSGENDKTVIVSFIVLVGIISLFMGIVSVIKKKREMRI